ncbi:MAG TPA: T9SS type A sorting domain-containing protein [Puia sp.]|nr:T9SS type A sorting domain-containing protein [Puia sp.]
MYNINVPKFSPDSGTLVSVNLSATVTSQYGFTLTNADNASATYTLTLGQDDQITGNVLSSPFSNIITQQINSYPLASGQVVSQPPFAFLTNHVSNDSITGNVAPFLGSGAVMLNYLSFTYTDLSTVNNATYSYSASINNVIHFTVKYYYSTSGGAVLATTLTRFSAALTAPHITGLAWAAVNETANRVYDIQRSRDGKDFTTVNSIGAQGDASGADYSYTDNLADSISGNVFYRLQIHDQANLSFSAIQEVNVASASPAGAAATTTTTGLRVFPNPATSYINLQTGQAPADWEVDIIAASGAVVLRTQAMASSTIYVPFTNKLAAGTYFVRLTGLHGQQPIMAPFIVIPYN